MNHTVSLGTIGHPLANSTDMITFHGNYYSAFAPGMAIFSFPFAILGFLLDGQILGAAGVMDKLFLALFGSLGILLVYKICKLYAKPSDSLLAGLALAFGTSVWPFTTAIFDHVLTMTLLVTATYLILCRITPMIRSLRNAFWYFGITGLILGAASLVDYFASLTLLPVLVYLVYAISKTATLAKYGFQLLLLTAMFLIGVLTNLLYNASIFGNPFIFPEQFFGSSSTPLIERFSLVGILPHLAYNLFSPYRGLLLLSPVLALGIVGYYMVLKRKTYGLDAALMIALLLVFLIPYSAWNLWEGGWSYGPRFLIPGLPFLIMPLAYLLSANKSRLLYAVFFVLFIASSSIQGLGALINATPEASNSLLTFQALHSLRDFYHGYLDVWWPGSADTYRIFGIFIFLFIWSLTAYYTRQALREIPEIESR